MFNYEAHRERENALFQESMTRAEHMQAAIHEWARNVGADNAEDCWILTDFDTWVQNPNYTGEPQPHPEDER